MVWTICDFFGPILDQKTFEKAFFFMRRRNQTPCPLQGQNIFARVGVGGTLAQLNQGRCLIKKYANRLEIRFLLGYTARMCRPSSAGRALHS